MFRVEIGFWGQKSKQELLLELLRDLGAGLQIESSWLCLRSLFLKCNEKKSWIINTEEIKENKLLKIEVKIWQSRILRWIKGKQAGIKYLNVRQKSEEVQDCFYVIVSSELELALVLQQWTVSQWMFLSEIVRLSQSAGNLCFPKLARAVYLEMFWDFVKLGYWFPCLFFIITPFLMYQILQLIWCYDLGFCFVLFFWTLFPNDGDSVGWFRRGPGSIFMDWQNFPQAVRCPWSGWLRQNKGTTSQPGIILWNE